MLSFCKCKSWTVNMPQIVAQQVFCSNQSAAPKYKSEGSKMKYCPWCGNKLYTVSEDNDNYKKGEE